MGNDIIDMVRNFFQDGVMLVDLNMTNVVLIPKKKCPTGLGDLRPISLCNVLVKILTKVLANRMKKVMDNVVSEN